MNLNDQHIDDLFRNAADASKSPEYNPSYWNEMELLLNAERNRKKGLIAWSIFGTFLIFGLLTTAVLIDGDHPVTYVQNELNTDLTPYYTPSVKSNYEENIAAVNIPSPQASMITSSRSLQGEQFTDQTINNSSKNLHAVSHDLTKEPYMINSIEVDYLTAIDLTSLPNTGLSEIEEIEGSPELFNLSTRQLPSYSPFSNSLDIGTGISQTYAENSRNPRIFSAGWKLNYQLNRVELSTGLGLSLEKNPGITVSERAKVYGFGVTNFENSLNYQTLLDVTIPLQLAVMHKKNKFGVGVQFRYLANSSMLFESKENGETMEAQNLSGLTTGLNPLNVDTYIFYERSIAENIHLGARLTQQLTSRISNDKYFNNLDRTSVFNAQVYFKYTLFNR